MTPAARPSPAWQEVNDMQNGPPWMAIIVVILVIVLIAVKMIWRRR